jgi:hypothetical protein
MVILLPQVDDAEGLNLAYRRPMESGAASRLLFVYVILGWPG